MKFTSTETGLVIQQQHPQNKGNRAELHLQTVGMMSELQQLLLWFLFCFSEYSLIKETVRMQFQLCVPFQQSA